MFLVMILDLGVKFKSYDIQLKPSSKQVGFRSGVQKRALRLSINVGVYSMLIINQP